MVSGCSDSAMQNNSNSQMESSNQEAKSESPDKTENQAEKSLASNVEVPSELSDNQEVKAYFTALRKVNDEYATMLEKMAKNTKESKEEGGMSHGDAMKNMQDMAASAKKMAPLTRKMDSLKQKEAKARKELKRLKRKYSKEQLEAASQGNIEPGMPAELFKKVAMKLYTLERSDRSRNGTSSYLIHSKINISYHLWVYTRDDKVVRVTEP